MIAIELVSSADALGEWAADASKKPGYDLFVTRQGDIALIVVDIAGHGATEGILALRCKEVLRTLLMSGAERKFVPWLEKYRTS